MTFYEYVEDALKESKYLISQNYMANMVLIIYHDFKTDFRVRMVAQSVSEFNAENILKYVDSMLQHYQEVNQVYTLADIYNGLRVLLETGIRKYKIDNLGL